MSAPIATFIFIVPLVTAIGIVIATDTVSSF
jgi:hypothetical protein